MAAGRGVCSLTECSAHALRVQVSEKQGGKEGGRGRQEKIHLPSSFPWTHNALHQLGSSADPASPPRSRPRERGTWWEEAVCTHREDHLQVVEHLNLLREALAAPSHQVVLTAGREGQPVTARASTLIQSKYPPSHYCAPHTLLAAGDRAVLETDAVPPSKRSRSRQEDRC